MKKAIWIKPELGPANFSAAMSCYCECRSGGGAGTGEGIHYQFP